MLEAESEGEARRIAAGIPPMAIAVPASLQASLMSRLDRLGPAKEVAQIGGAIGREFSHRLLEAVVAKPEAQLRSGLDRLVDSGLLFRQGVPNRINTKRRPNPAGCLKEAHPHACLCGLRHFNGLRECPGTPEAVPIVEPTAMPVRGAVGGVVTAMRRALCTSSSVLGAGTCITCHAPVPHTTPARVAARAFPQRPHRVQQLVPGAEARDYKRGFVELAGVEGGGQGRTVPILLPGLHFHIFRKELPPAAVQIIFDRGALSFDAETALALSRSANSQV
jgi:hypothetical protein